MRNIEKVIRPYCYKIIPLIYDDSLSYYEVLCKLRAKLNEVIEALNLNYNVADEVNRILNEWLEDGTLEEMIDSALDNVQVVYPEYVATTCKKDGRYTSEESFCVQQSFCIYSADVAIAVYGQPDGAGASNNNCQLVKFNPNSGLEIGYPTTIEGGHANDIATDGGKIYVSWLYDYTGTYTNKITVCDINFNYLYTLTPTGIPYVAGIDFNRDTQLFYLYCADKIYVYDSTLSTLQKIIDLDIDYYRNYFSNTLFLQAQTVTCLPKGFMINYAHPNVSIRYDENGKIEKIYNYENYENGFVNMEIEKVAYNPFDRYFYISSFARQGCGDIANNVYGRFNLKKGQLKYTYPIRTTRLLYYPTSDQRYAAYFVNTTINDNARMLGTVTFPFKYAQQAIDCLKQSRYKAGRIFILEASDGDDIGTLALSGIDNVHIATQNNIRVTTKQLQIIHSNNIEMYYMDINSANLANNGNLRFGAVNINRVTNLNLIASLYLQNTTLIGANDLTANGIGFARRTESDNTVTISRYNNCYDIGSPIT